MKDFDEVAPGIFYLRSRRALTFSDIEWLKAQIGEGGYPRARICTHSDTSSRVHEMIIAHTKSGYVQPHRHPGKSESSHVIEGAAQYILFSEDGEIEDIIPLGGQLSKGFYYRLDLARYHTQIFLSDFFVFHEVIEGPFVPGEAEFAPWAPSESDNEAVNDYSLKLRIRIDEFLKRDLGR